MNGPPFGSLGYLGADVTECKEKNVECVASWLRTRRHGLVSVLPSQYDADAHSAKRPSSRDLAK